MGIRDKPIAPLEINNNGSVGGAFAPAPVIDRDRTQRFGFTMLTKVALQLPEDSAVANGYPQARQQPFADSAAGGMAEQLHEFANSARSPGKRQRDRQLFGECPSCALLVEHFQSAERSSTVAGTPWIGRS
jgi:hypothetical protein